MMFLFFVEIYVLIQQQQQTFIKKRNILACLSVPSAVSIMLERLCPRLMPLTAGGKSNLDPLSWGVEDVTSGGTLFSGGRERGEGGGAVSATNGNEQQKTRLCIGVNV